MSPRVVRAVSWAVLALVAPGSAPDDIRPERVGTLRHAAIREASGIAASRRHPGVFWVHNDSGNPPTLFAVRRDGTLIREYRVDAPNVDWEDIAVDDSGHIYLGDIGNNKQLLLSRTVYKIDEPDPAEPFPGKLPATIAATYVGFKKGERFDSEGFYLDGDRIVLISKRRDGGVAGLHAVPLVPPAPHSSTAYQPKAAGELPGFTEPATGASLSHDGRRLAVCSTAVVRVYDKSDAGWTLARTLRYALDDQVEAVCWVDGGLILAGEGRGMYAIPASAIGPDLTKGR